MKPRCVFDTNVVLSALLFRRGRLAPLRETWAAEVIPLASVATVHELTAVLNYRKFALTAADVTEALALYVPHLSLVDVVEVHPLQCRDPRDQKFLDLAHAAAADMLISGDSDLLSLAGQTRFAILTPAEFLAR